MLNQATFSIDAKRYMFCEQVVDTGEFLNMSSLVDYALHEYLYHIRTDGVRSIPLVARAQRSKDRVSKTLTVTRKIIDELSCTGFFNVSAMADYALDYLFVRLGWVNDRGEYDITKVPVPPHVG